LGRDPLGGVVYEYELGFSAGITHTNNRGDVVGANVLWTAGRLIDLGMLPGGEPVIASATVAVLRVDIHLRSCPADVVVVM
jgi:hypothetical protein